MANVDWSTRVWTMLDHDVLTLQEAIERLTLELLYLRARAPSTTS